MFYGIKLKQIIENPKLLLAIICLYIVLQYDEI